MFVSKNLSENLAGFVLKTELKLGRNVGSRTYKHDPLVYWSSLLKTETPYTKCTASSLWHINPFWEKKKEKTYFQWCSPDPVGILEWAPTRWVPNPGLAVMYYEVLRTSTATTTAVAAYALCTPAASALALPPRPVWSTTEISLYHGYSLSHTRAVVRLWWDCFFSLCRTTQ